jgi:hypothetical protein
MCRWIIYAGNKGNQPFNTFASVENIPVEWYNWLHSITANAPPVASSQRPIYFLDRRASADVPDVPHQRYMPKGAWSNTNKVGPKVNRNFACTSSAGYAPSS